MINLEKFKSIIERLKNNHKMISELYTKYNIDLINFTDSYDSIINDLMKEIFNELQIDIIEWWLYESVDKFIYDSTTKEIIHDLTSIENLYTYIINI